MLATTAKVARDPTTGKSKCYGFVSYTDFESADQAIEAINNQFLMNKAITVQYAFKKDGKGERHGTPAERLLAAQARKNNALPVGARPPPATLGALAAFGPPAATAPAPAPVAGIPTPATPVGAAAMGVARPPGVPYPGPYQGQFAGVLSGGAVAPMMGTPMGAPMGMSVPPPPPGFGGPSVPGPSHAGFGVAPPPPPGFGPPQGFGGVPGMSVPPPPPGFGAPMGMGGMPPGMGGGMPLGMGGMPPPPSGFGMPMGIQPQSGVPR